MAVPYFRSEDGRFQLYLGDCLDLLPRLELASRVDLAVADPPYGLSGGGTTCQSGQRVPVDKGTWDRPGTVEEDHAFAVNWLRACREVLKPAGALWVSGTMHGIHSVGYGMQTLGMRILNDVTWEKPAPPPNLGCRCFTHAAETLIWAARDENCRYTFNYQAMKEMNGGKQMKSVWRIAPPGAAEKVHGRHPTQKPLELMERILLACTNADDLVLDPFAGSGTTGIAAAKLGRRFIGIDMETEYLDVAVKRYRALQDEVEGLGQPACEGEGPDGGPTPSDLPDAA
jgi:site-specific DNA-methyltransferase (adenine-specific)